MFKIASIIGKISLYNPFGIKSNRNRLFCLVHLGKTSVSLAANPTFIGVLIFSFIEAI